MRTRIVLLAFWFLVATVPAVASPVVVFIVAGQSNAVGYGSDASLLPPPLDAPQSDVGFWFDEGPFFALANPSLRIDSGDMQIPLQFQTDGSGLTFSGPVNGFGPEIKLGRVLADALSVDVAIVKFAVSGSSLAVDWNPATAGSLYHQMRDDLAGALAALAVAGDGGQVGAVFWMQGEADAQTSETAAAYEANVTGFIDRLRTEFFNGNLPFVFGRINVNIDSSCCFSFPFKDEVRTAQANVAGAVPGTAMVDTDDLPLISDSVHFTAGGQLGLGERFANAYLALPVVCGDGIIGIGEQCDDGNLVDGDCCSAACVAESSSCPDLAIGRSAVIRPGQIVRVAAKPLAGTAFELPAPASNPTTEGGNVRFFDTLTGAGAVTYALQPVGWKGLGSPPGSRGYRYKGSFADPCRSVLIKPTQVKAVCKGAAVTLSPPFAGELGVLLTAGSTIVKRYCLAFGGETKENMTDVFVRKNAPAPPACPVAAP